MAKRGKFSKAELEYVHNHYGDKSAAVIASDLDRKLETVQEYITLIEEANNPSQTDDKKFSREQLSDRQKFHQSQVQAMMNHPEGIPGVTVMTEGASGAGDTARDKQQPTISRKAKGAVRVIKKER